MKETATTEQDMRAAKCPWPESPEELVEYINSLTEREHDYGTCVYAMSLAAVAAFNYVGKKLGTTGFQASCADLDILRRTRLLDCPFIILKARDMLYPQYDLRENLKEAMDGWKDWAREEAAKNLKESGDSAHPNVVEHWKKLAHKV